MRKTILFLSVSLITLMTYSQPAEWARRSGGTNSDDGNSVCKDLNGNIYVTGGFTSSTITFGSTTLSNAGTTNVYIAKYDANGNVLWAKSAGGISNDVSYSISTDANGNVYIVGGFTSSTMIFGSTTLTNGATNGTVDFFIAKYDPSGNVLWAKQSSSNEMNNDYGSSIKTDANGNSFVSGFYRNDSITFGSITLTNYTGYSAFFIVKYDASGNALWAKSTAGAADNNPRSSIAFDVNSNVFLSGNFVIHTIIFGNDTLTNANTNFTEDFFIAKYDASGNVLWAKSAGGSAIDCCKGITTDNIGNVFVTGFFYSNSITIGTATFTNAGSGDFFIAKYDVAGNILWAKNAGGSSSEYGYEISTDINNNIYVCGIFSSPTLSFGTNTLLYNNCCSITGGIFIVKYDASGNVLMAETTGGANLGNGNVCIDRTVNNSIYLAGTFVSTAVFDTTSLTSNAGSRDIFVAKLCANPPPVPTITQNGNSLASSSANSYKWYFYSNPIAGATSQNYQPTLNGYYTVIIVDGGGCSAISAPLHLVNASVIETNFPEVINISPNPFTSQTTITFAEIQRNTTVKIMDVLGKDIKTINFTGKQLTLEKGEMNNGIYFVQIADENKKVINRKILVQ